PSLRCFTSTWMDWAAHVQFPAPPRAGAVALSGHVRQSVALEDAVDRVAGHVHVVIPLEEEADPERAVLPLAADLQDQRHDMRRGRVGVVTWFSRPVLKPWQSRLPVTIPPPIEQCPRDPEEP